MEHIIHLPEFRVVVCKGCQHAILPSEIESHFTNRPHQFTKDIRQGIIERVAHIKGLIQNIQQLEQCEFSFLVDTAEPVAVLAAPNTNGLRCMLEIGSGICSYVSTAVRKMRKHCWEEHD